MFSCLKHGWVSKSEPCRACHKPPSLLAPLTQLRQRKRQLDELLRCEMISRAERDRLLGSAVDEAVADKEQIPR